MNERDELIKYRELISQIDSTEASINLGIMGIVFGFLAGCSTQSGINNFNELLPHIMIGGALGSLSGVLLAEYIRDKYQ